MQDKLRLVVKQEGQKDTTFVHIVSGHEKVTDNDFTRTKTAAKVSHNHKRKYFHQLY